jgi:glucose-6-phosphate isomerase
MLKLDNKNAGFKDINSDKLDHYWELIKSRGQGFIDLPKDNNVLDQVKAFASSVEGKYAHIVILGIGGSMLGPKCILEALYSPRPGLQIHYLDNIDPHKISQIASNIDLSKTLFLVQTKSGGTPETISQYLYFRNQVNTHNLDAKDHFVFVTDPQKGYLRQVANLENIPSFVIPENVGGRFSVLTPVGLLVAALVGLDIDSMLSGAQSVLDNQLSEAYTLATIQHSLSESGKSINVIMPYSSRLKTFSEWCVQLISESLGKEFDLDGNLVNTGITPLPAVGATDQHSQLQLFAEGPNDKLIIFIKPQDYGVEIDIPHTNEESLTYLNGHSFNQLLDAEFKGVSAALTERDRPNLTIEIDQVNEFSLGELFMFFELATAFVGVMLNINTFDQPGVERGKVLSRKNLIK